MKQYKKLNPAFFNKFVFNYIKVILLFFCLLGCTAFFGFNYFKTLIAEKHNKNFLAYYFEKNDTLASFEINNAIELCNNNAVYWGNKGMLLSRNINFDIDCILKSSTLTFSENYLTESLECFDKAAELNPEDGAFVINKAWIYLLMNNMDKALFNFNRSVQLDPNSSMYYISRGLFFEKQKLLNYAVADYAVALRNSPEILDSFFFEDFIFRHPEIADSIINISIEYLVNAVSITNSPILKARLANFFLYKNQVDRAEKLFVEVTMQLPNLNRPWFYLGKISELKKDTTNFIRNYARASMLDPMDYLARIPMGEYYYNSDKKASLSYYKASVRLWALVYSDHFYRGTILYENSKILYNDILPQGILQYIKPRFDYKKYCQRISDIYSSIGDAENATIYHKISIGELTVSTILKDTK